MGMKHIAIVATAALTAVAAHAGTSATTVENSHRAELKEIHATRLNGTSYAIKDAACQAQFGRMVGKTVDVNYTIDTQNGAAYGTARFDGATIPLTAVKMNGSYGFVTTNVPFKLTNQYIDHIRVFPGATDNATQAVVQMTGATGDYLCNATTSL